MLITATCHLSLWKRSIIGKICCWCLQTSQNNKKKPINNHTNEWKMNDWWNQRTYKKICKWMIEHMNEWNGIKFQRWLTWAQIRLADTANVGLTRVEQPSTFHSSLALFCFIECQFSCGFLEQEVRNYNFLGVFPVCLSIRGGAFWSMSLQARNVGQIPPPNKPIPQKQGAPPLTDNSSRPQRAIDPGNASWSTSLRAKLGAVL